MKRFVCGEVGLGSLEEPFNDRGEVLRSLPSKPPSSCNLPLNAVYLRLVSCHFAAIANTLFVPTSIASLLPVLEATEKGEVVNCYP